MFGEEGRVGMREEGRVWGGGESLGMREEGEYEMQGVYIHTPLSECFV